MGKILFPTTDFCQCLFPFKSPVQYVFSLFWLRKENQEGDITIQHIHTAIASRHMTQNDAKKSFSDLLLTSLL